MANAAACLELAEFIERQETFNMDCSVCVPQCGSVGCIGGSAAFLWPQIREPFVTFDDGTEPNAYT